MGMLTSCKPSIDVNLDILRPHMSAFGKEVRKTDQLYLYRDNMFMENAERLEIVFDTPQIPTVDEARRLYVDIVNRFIDKTNKNETIRPYLFQHPLSIQDVNIKIYFSELPNESRSDVINRMDMQYRVDSERQDHNIYYFKDTRKDSACIFFKETFEEAVEKLKLEASVNEIKETPS